MATVITNLISAIPWIGQDIVESKNNIVIFTIFIYIIPVLYGLFVFITNIIIKFTKLDTSLPTIGTVHKNALKKNPKSIRLDKQEYLLLPSSFLAFLVGLIDGDGYIQIGKTPKGYITMRLVISLHQDDVSCLEYIQSVLKLGSVNVYKDLKSPTCRLVINKTDLQEVLFPLLVYNNLYFLTNTRVEQFNLAMFILKNDIKLYSELPKLENIPIVFDIPKTPLDFTLLPFFKNWIVGFTTAEGSFFIKANNEGCFQLKQRAHIDLFEAFKLIFQTNRKIDITNNFNQFSVSSKADIQKVIYYFSFSGLHPLMGLKYIQYVKWLNDLRKSSRYSNLNYP